MRRYPSPTSESVSRRQPHVCLATPGKKAKPGPGGIFGSFGSPAFSGGVGETLGFPPTPHSVFGFSGTLATKTFSPAYPPCLKEAFSGQRSAIRPDLSPPRTPSASAGYPGRQDSLAWQQTGPKQSHKTTTPSLVSSREGVDPSFGPEASAQLPPARAVRRLGPWLRCRAYIRSRLARVNNFLFVPC